MLQKYTAYDVVIGDLAMKDPNLAGCRPEDFVHSAQRKAEETLEALRAAVGRTHDGAVLQWQLFQHQRAAEILERVLDVDSVQDGEDPGDRLMETVARINGAPPVPVLTPADVASQTSSSAATLRAQLKEHRSQIDRLRRTLHQKGLEPLPADATFEEVKASVLSWLVVWMQELGNAARKRYTNIRYGQATTVKPGHLAPAKQDQLHKNVQLFNDICRQSVHPFQPLTAHDVLNSDSWLEERNMADFGDARRPIHGDSYKFMNAVFGIMRAVEELIATQHEMIGFVYHVAARFREIHASVRALLLAILSGTVRCVLFFLRYV
jgi:hypothetical protein